jgi:hypothetical protein
MSHAAAFFIFLQLHKGSCVADAYRTSIILLRYWTHRGLGFPTHVHLTSSHQSSYASELTTQKKVRSNHIAAVGANENAIFDQKSKVTFQSSACGELAQK